MPYRSEKMRTKLYEIIDFWRGLGSRKGARDYVKEWVRPKPVSELEIIIRRGGLKGYAEGKSDLYP
jgi:hypothetical protein